MFRARKRRKAELARNVEELVETDLDKAAAQFASVRRELSSSDAERLADVLTRRIDAREHQTYLARGLADGSIGPTAAFELLDTYQDAGYLTPNQAERLQNRVFEAHRRELLDLLATPGTSRFDYFRLLDSYRSSGYLGHDELEELEYVIHVKLNPELAASRLFGQAQVALDPALQEDLLQRYLMEFPGFRDYAHASSLYLSLRIDAHWQRLAQITSARTATLQTRELHALLQTYLPHTSDLGEYVPIEEIVRDLHAHARDFEPEAEADELITEEDVGRRVVVTHRKAGDGYREDRNRLVDLGATGRVVATNGHKILVRHSGPGFTYSKSWGLPAFHRVHLAGLPRKTDLAVWDQSEIGMMNQRRASPVFVHQYQAAVARLAHLLEQHREDNSGSGIEGSLAVERLMGPAGE